MLVTLEKMVADKTADQMWLPYMHQTLREWLSWVMIFNIIIIYNLQYSYHSESEEYVSHSLNDV